MANFIKAGWFFRTKANQLAADRATCIAAYMEAKRRRDTRALNQAAARLRDATILELRGEVRR